ncbi:zinc metalloproteinase nas-13-like [Actinia tenebrosa]|uniref:Metalloendopeptidase n=1 Tax=Actinia tenebrosa TaxID=6105 RepID=A0A6P8H2I2_ACTTE|nr:zinc metalloproteinase nas-13-like [Actinia tenebrosa]
MKAFYLWGLFSVFIIVCKAKSEARDDFHPHHVIRKRGAVRYHRLLWPAVIDYDYKVVRVNIPYTIKTGFWWFFGLGNNDVKMIKEAMAGIEKHTCLRFVPRESQKDYVEFYKDQSNACESSIGRQRGKQTIALGDGCMSPGHVSHEIMHTLGFFHEHTRPDRDNYIKILWDNIKKGNEIQFKIRSSMESTNLGQPYDFRSIMHYHRKEFSKNGKNTIESLQDPNMELGSMNSLSAIDVMQINRLYRCPQGSQRVENFRLTVYTGNLPFAGTDAKVFVELYGILAGERTNSGEVQIYAKDGHFETGGTDKFNVVAPDLGQLTKLTVRHNNQGFGAAWYLNKIDVEDDKRKKKYTFSCSCWISGDHNTKTLMPSV